MRSSSQSSFGDRPVAGACVVGRYRIERLLGRGGMGSVWQGRDEQLERAVAVKFMSPEVAANEELRQRFVREAKAAAKLRTRHVAEVYDYGVDGTTPFIVMELLEGQDLRSLLERLGRLPHEAVTRIVIQAAKALERAQEAGIVHRDIKPANLFLARDRDDEEVVKVLDFGVAKSSGPTHEERTTSGIVLGSPPYLSPEQARGGEVDQRSDLWGLAAVAYRALTGQNPFRGKTDADVVVKICTEPAPPPSQIVPELVPFDAFFGRAFRREPAERFPTAAAFARAFCHAAGVDVSSGRWLDASGRMSAFSVPPADSSRPGSSGPPSGTPSGGIPLLQTPLPVSTSGARSIETPRPWHTEDGRPQSGISGRAKALIAVIAASVLLVVVAGVMLGRGAPGATEPAPGASAAAADTAAPPTATPTSTTSGPGATDTATAGSAPPKSGTPAKAAAPHVATAEPKTTPRPAKGDKGDKPTWGY